MQEQVPAFWIFLINRIHHSLLAAKDYWKLPDRPDSVHILLLLAHRIRLSRGQAAGIKNLLFNGGQDLTCDGSRWQNKRIFLPFDSWRLHIQMSRSATFRWEDPPKNDQRNGCNFNSFRQAESSHLEFQSNRVAGIDSRHFSRYATIQ